MVPSSLLSPATVCFGSKVVHAFKGRKPGPDVVNLTLAGLAIAVAAVHDAALLLRVSGTDEDGDEQRQGFVGGKLASRRGRTRNSRSCAAIQSMLC